MNKTICLKPKMHSLKQTHVAKRIYLFRALRVKITFMCVNLRLMQLCILLFPSHSKAKLKPSFVGASVGSGGAFFLTFFFFGSAALSPSPNKARTLANKSCSQAFPWASEQANLTFWANSPYEMMAAFSHPPCKFCPACIFMCGVLRSSHSSVDAQNASALDSSSFSCLALSLVLETLICSHWRLPLFKLAKIWTDFSTFQCYYHKISGEKPPFDAQCPNL